MKIFICLITTNTDYVCFCSLSIIANKALEEKLQEMNDTRDMTVAELKERIQALEKELDNANELLSSSKLRGQLGLFYLF